jgi:hypothetical protein
MVYDTTTKYNEMECLPPFASCRGLAIQWPGPRASRPQEEKNVDDKTTNKYKTDVTIDITIKSCVTGLRPETSQSASVTRDQDESTAQADIKVKSLSLFLVIAYLGSPATQTKSLFS